MVMAPPNTTTRPRSGSGREPQEGVRALGAHELSARLWRERELLELLTFKLEEEQLLLNAGKTRWLPFATREVEQVLERLKQSSLERSIEVSDLALEWGTDEDATLRQIVDRAPTEAWRETFASHLKALDELASGIAALRDSNLQFLRAASRSTQETLAHIVADSGTYDASGSADIASPRARLLDDEF